MCVSVCVRAHVPVSLQAKSLDFLRSSGLVIQPIDLTLDAAPEAEEALPAAPSCVSMSLSLKMSESIDAPADLGPVSFRPGPRNQVCGLTLQYGQLH